jgi:hypothetical protein
VRKSIDVTIGSNAMDESSADNEDTDSGEETNFKKCFFHLLSDLRAQCYEHNFRRVSPISGEKKF